MITTEWNNKIPNGGVTLLRTPRLWNSQKKKKHTKNSVFCNRLRSRHFWTAAILERWELQESECIRLKVLFSKFIAVVSNPLCFVCRLAWLWCVWSCTLSRLPHLQDDNKCRRCSVPFWTTCSIIASFCLCIEFACVGTMVIVQST